MVMAEVARTGVDLRGIFLGLQRQMIAKLSTNRAAIVNPGAKGEATELGWIDMLDSYLPKRYQVAKAFAIDCEGQISQEIDIIVFDRQYSPFLFNQDNAVYVPAESVYCVIEVRQDLGKEHIEYAGSKAASVRRLRRTSAPIPHAGGTFPAKEPFRILGGIVALDSLWTPPFGPSFETTIGGLASLDRIDFGCALQCGSFQVKYERDGGPLIEKSEQEDSLISFFLHLLSQLQLLGTVPALDIAEYAKSLKRK